MFSFSPAADGGGSFSPDVSGKCPDLRRTGHCPFLALACRASSRSSSTAAAESCVDYVRNAFVVAASSRAAALARTSVEKTPSGSGQWPRAARSQCSPPRTTARPPAYTSRPLVESQSIRSVRSRTKLPPYGFETFTPSTLRRRLSLQPSAATTASAAASRPSARQGLASPSAARPGAQRPALARPSEAHRPDVHGRARRHMRSHSLAVASLARLDARLGRREMMIVAHHARPPQSDRCSPTTRQPDLTQSTCASRASASKPQ